MQPMVKNELLSHFINHNRIIHSETIKICGIGEFKVETILINILSINRLILRLRLWREVMKYILD